MARTINPAPKQIVVIQEDPEVKLNEDDKTLPPNIGEVQSSGSEVELYEKGDKVIYKPFHATIVKLKKKEYALIDHRDILGTIEEK